ncbi:MAG: NUDIX domain-containing protein [Candidatus Saccharimonadales bacterium]
MAHIHTQSGQFDYTVAGYLVHDNKTLLIKHKYLPIWTAPAGHIELDESPIETLYKEILEESGIDQSHLTLIETHAETRDWRRGDQATYVPVPFDMEYHDIIDGHRHINMNYILTCDTDIVQPGEGESPTYQWFTIDELEAFTETRPSIVQSAIYAIKYIREHQS